MSIKTKINVVPRIPFSIQCSKQKVETIAYNRPTDRPTAFIKNKRMKNTCYVFGNFY